MTKFILLVEDILLNWDLMTSTDITDTADPSLITSESEKDGTEGGNSQNNFGGGCPPTDIHSRVTFVFSNTWIVSFGSPFSWRPINDGEVSIWWMISSLGACLTTKVLTFDTRASRA